MTRVTCRLTAKNRDQLRNPTLGNRVWATFTFYPRWVLFPLQDTTLAVVWRVLQIVRPETVSHCRLCNCCYAQVDHHCLYLHRCIAVANHRLFVLFTALVMASMFTFEYSCIVYASSLYVGRPLADWAVIADVFATCPAIWSLFILNGMSLVWTTWVLHTQIVAISKGRLHAYQSYRARSWLSKRQRLVNVVNFFLDKSPYLRDEVSNP